MKAKYSERLWVILGTAATGENSEESGVITSIMFYKGSVNVFLIQ